MRDAFAVLFFVSVGMLFDPAALLAAPGLVAATLAVVLVGKPAAALAIVLLLGYPVRVALAVSVALAQIGEFSFILATLGIQLGVLPDAATHAIVPVAIASITVNPLLYRFVDRVALWAARRPRLAALARPQSAAPPQPPADRALPPKYRAVVVGYGPVGQTVTRLLRANDIEPTVIELNLDTVRRLWEEGVRAVYGDATHRETLKVAGVDRAGSLILSSAGMGGSEEVIRMARELNPDIRVLARSAYVREMDALRRAGAESVFAGEGEVALALTEVLLRRLGATPEQIDRERERVRRELSGPPA
jgi:CPA2 family monovalent cation:H+ antiporter-2